MKKIKKVLIVSTVLLLLYLLVSCSSGPQAAPSSSQIASQAPVSSQPATSGSTAPQGNAAVSIQNFSFNPGTLTVKVGTTVVWTNNDSATHTVKSTNFDSGNIAPGQTFSFKFATAGTYDYSCGIHPTMTGQIIVQ